MVVATIRPRSQCPVVHARNALRKRIRRMTSDTSRPWFDACAAAASSVFAGRSDNVLRAWPYEAAHRHGVKTVTLAMRKRGMNERSPHWLRLIETVEKR